MAVGDSLLCGKVVLRLPAGFLQGNPIPVNISHGISDNAKTPIPQKIDFNQTRCLGAVLFPLKNGHPFGSHFQGRISIDGIRCNHHSTGVNRKIAWDTCNSMSQIKDPGPGLWEVHVFELRQLPESRLQRNIISLCPQIKGHPFCQSVDFPGRQTKDLGNLT